MNTKWKEWLENKRIHLVVSVIMVILSSFLQASIILTFLSPSNLISGGFTGFAMLISKVLDLFFSINFPISLGILLLNIPACLLCYKGISKRFTLLSCLQFGLVSFFLQVLHAHPLSHDLVLNVFFGGFLYGVSIVLALKANASTGGTDFIALYVSNKIHKSTWGYVFLFNTSMYIIFGFLFGWRQAGYTILFQFISTKTIESFYNRYAQVTIEITTKYPTIITKTFTQHFRHGMSVIQAYGAYSGHPVYICKTVVSSYEEPEIVQCIRAVQPNVIINSYKTNHFYGRFYQKPME